MARLRDIERRDRIVAAITADIPGFAIKFKDSDHTHSIISRIVEKVSFEGGVLRKLWSTWMNYAATSIYPKIFFPTQAAWDAEPTKKARTLQHEWVHLKDGQTFYGLLPKSLKWLNLAMFSAAYAAPQLFALLALGAPVAWLLGADPGHWWLLATLLMLAPLPSPGRMYAELRAYRRTVELGGDPNIIAGYFAGYKYWWMWPFKKQVVRLLAKPSPYKSEMDAVW